MTEWTKELTLAWQLIEACGGPEGARACVFNAWHETNGRPPAPASSVVPATTAQNDEGASAAAHAAAFLPTREPLGLEQLEVLARYGSHNGEAFNADERILLASALFHARANAESRSLLAAAERRVAELTKPATEVEAIQFEADVPYMQSIASDYPPALDLFIQRRAASPVQPDERRGTDNG